MSNTINEEEQNPEPQPPTHLSPTTYLMIGVVAGSIASVILVAYINKQNANNKLKKRKFKKSGPSSGSPLTALDEEKSA